MTITANVSEYDSENVRAEVEEVEVPIDVLVNVTDRAAGGVQLKAEGGILTGLKKFIDNSVKAMYSEEDKRKQEEIALKKKVENLEKKLELAKQEIENGRS